VSVESETLKAGRDTEVNAGKKRGDSAMEEAEGVSNIEFNEQG
jgi:hypothetical protein